MDQLIRLQEKLGYTFTNKKLIIEALTHKSYKQPYNNERLEFLGDAVLDLIVGEYLFSSFPNYNEGHLSKMRASMVNEDGFTQLARHIDLGAAILLSNAEENNDGRNKPSLLSNAYEAVIGAIYLESGLERARIITVRMLETVHKEITLDSLLKDYKTALQELTQAHFGTTPEYRLIGSSGPDHKKEFTIAVIINNKEYARASGKSKKTAQQEAASIAMLLLKKELS
ncbi:MAG: ribonuclease III [Epsilonproteobacteria bacterium]|nr:MAG: ribonuclease III [Campylobacterota bacterium]